MDDVYALYRSIRDNRLPRNRHFEAHASPDCAEARRLHRFLRGVGRDVLAADSVAVHPRSGGVVLAMAFSAVRLVREVTLTAGEHALLVEDAAVAARLAHSLAE